MLRIPGSRTLAVMLALLLPEFGTASEQPPTVTCPPLETNLIPHQFECSSFFQCNRNDTTPSLLLRCPNETHFSQASPTACQRPEEAPCTPLITVTRLSHSAESPICPSESALNYVYLVRNPVNCSQFFRCYQGVAQLFECPPYWYFDPLYEVCKLARQPECPPGNDELILLPHPTNCSAFYKCNWGTPVLLYCPQGLFFNNISKVCDLPQNVDCNRCHI
jgi:hypothetical protein